MDRQALRICLARIMPFLARIEYRINAARRKELHSEMICRCRIPQRERDSADVESLFLCKQENKGLHRPYKELLYNDGSIDPIEVKIFLRDVRCAPALFGYLFLQFIRQTGVALVCAPGARIELFVHVSDPFH